MHVFRDVKGLFATAVGCLALVSPVSAQNLAGADASTASSLFERYSEKFSVLSAPYQAPFSSETRNSSEIGMLFSPAKGLDLRADAWRVELDKTFSTATALPEAANLLPTVTSNVGSVYNIKS